MNQPGVVVYLIFPAEENAREAAWELSEEGREVELITGSSEGGWGLAVYLSAGEEPTPAIENMQPVIEAFDGLLDHWGLESDDVDDEGEQE